MEELAATTSAVTIESTNYQKSVLLARNGATSAAYKRARAITATSMVPAQLLAAGARMTVTTTYGSPATSNVLPQMDYIPRARSDNLSSGNDHVGAAVEGSPSSLAIVGVFSLTVLLVTVCVTYRLHRTQKMQEPDVGIADLELSRSDFPDTQYLTLESPRGIMHV